MKRGQQRTGVQAGFTIVETMIVLAVTGVLFLAIAVTWSGRQHRTEFTSATNDIRSQLQQVVTDVQNGNFTDKGGYTCSSNGGSPNIVLDEGAGTQGARVQCVFMGKVVQFGFKNTNPESYRVYAVAALKDSAASATTLKDLRPAVIAMSSQNNGLNSNYGVDIGQLLYGLSISSMQAEATPGNWKPVDAVGFLARTGTLDEVTGALASGTEQIDLYAFDGNVNGLQTFVADTNSNSPSSDLNKAMSNAGRYYKNVPVKICFKSGATNQYAIVTLGTGSRQLQPELKIAGSCS